jgi:hypothetical protein
MGAVRVAALVLLGGISIRWMTFHSHVYRYTIKQPSSYTHIVLQDTSKRKVDYFYPSPLGSSVTSVSIFCDHSNPNLTTSLRSNSGVNVHRSGWITIMGKRYPLIEAGYTGIGVSWVVEKVNVPVGKEIYHLTASYEPRYRNQQRPIMLKMLGSFHSP